LLDTSQYKLIGNFEASFLPLRGAGLILSGATVRASLCFWMLSARTGSPMLIPEEDPLGEICVGFLVILGPTLSRFTLGGESFFGGASSRTLGDTADVARLISTGGRSTVVSIEIRQHFG